RSGVAAVRRGARGERGGRGECGGEEWHTLAFSSQHSAFSRETLNSQKAGGVVPTGLEAAAQPAPRASALGFIISPALRADVCDSCPHVRHCNALGERGLRRRESGPRTKL